MSSLFQGLVDSAGLVRTTTAPPNDFSFVFRGILLDAFGAVHVSTGDAIAGYVEGVPVSAEGVVCVNDTTTVPGETLPGALRLATTRLYTTSIDAPDVIHQGVGLRNEGRMCRLQEPSTVFQVKTTGTKTVGTSVPGDWSDANCYPDIQSAASQGAVSVDNLMVLDDETHTIAATISGTATGHIWEIRSKSGDPSRCTVEAAVGVAIVFNLNASTASPLTFKNIRFTRADTPTVTNAIYFQAAQAQGDLTFSNCILGDFDIAVATGNLLDGALVYSAASTARSVNFMDGTIIRGINLSGGGYQTLFRSRNEGDHFTFENVVFENLSRAGTISDFGFYYCERADITLKNVAFRNISSTNVAGQGHRPFIYQTATAAASVVNMENVVAEDYTVEGGTAGASIIAAVGACNVKNLQARRNVSTPGASDNALGGVLLFIGSAATGIVEGLLIEDCSFNFGGVYWSNGAGGSIENAVIRRCQIAQGAIYKGGFGSIDVQGVVVSDITQLPVVPVDENEGLGIYIHNTSTTPCTVNVRNVTVVNCDNPTHTVDGCRIRVLSTGALTVNFENYVSQNGGRSEGEISTDATGGGALTVNLDNANVQGGSGAISAGITIADLDSTIDIFRGNVNQPYYLKPSYFKAMQGNPWWSPGSAPFGADGKAFPNVAPSIGGLQSV